MKSTYLNLFAIILVAFMPKALSAQVPSYVPTDGLVGWWPFNGNANDESGNGNDGVVNGATLTDDRFGNSNSSYSFDGLSNFIQTADSPSLSFTEDFTISAWIKQGTPTTGYNSILSKRLGGNWSYSLSISNISGGSGQELNKLTSGRRNNNGAQTEYRFSNTTTSFEVWQHMLVVVKNDTLKFYLDGEDAGFVDGYNGYDGYVPFGNSFSIPMINQPVGITIGDCNCGLSEHMNGLIDDIALYNRALTEQEIQNLYTGTTPAACTALPANLQTGLVGYWPFCGNANDESGNGNDGVVNGATLTEDRFGNVNAAFSFDGNDWIESSAVGMSSGNNSATISGWFKRTSSASGVEYIAGYGNPNILQGTVFATGEYGAQGAFATFLGSSYDAISGIQLPIDSWHQLTSIHNQNGQVDIYLDGQLIYNATVQTPDIQNVLTRIGRAVWDSDEYWNGTLDDIGIWNRALTPEEVQELYTLDACTFTVYDTLTVENIINVYDTLTIENIVDIYDTTYINVEVYDTLTVENIINVYDTLTIENIVEVYDTITVENVIDVFDTTTVVETVVVFDTITVENVIDVFDTTTVVETVVVFDTLTVENVIDVFDTTTVVETVLVFDTLTVENVIDVYDTTYVTVTDTLIIDIPSGVGGNILNTLLLYPNPTSDQLTISYGNFAAMAGYSLSIFDNGGSAVHETSITQSQETLDITQWSAGVYQVVVYNAGGVPVETRQIVIQ